MGLITKLEQRTETVSLRDQPDCRSGGRVRDCQHGSFFTLRVQFIIKSEE